MNKKILLSVVLVLGLACVAYMMNAARRSAQSAPKQPAMPAGFASIKMGMSESAVLSLVGPPFLKGQYARYERKPSGYWAALQKQVSATDADQAAYSGAPSMAAIRAATELTHQYRDVWQYKPVPTTILTLYFNDQGTLLNEGTAVGGGKGLPGPGSHAPAPPARGR